MFPACRRAIDQPVCRLLVCTVLLVLRVSVWRASSLRSQVHAYLGIAIMWLRDFCYFRQRTASAVGLLGLICKRIYFLFVYLNWIDLCIICSSCLCEGGEGAIVSWTANIFRYSHLNIEEILFWVFKLWKKV